MENLAGLREIRLAALADHLHLASSPQLNVAVGTVWEEDMTLSFTRPQILLASTLNSGALKFTRCHSNSSGL